MAGRLRVVEDAVPGKQLNEMEERRQELIGEFVKDHAASDMCNLLSLFSSVIH